MAENEIRIKVVADADLAGMKKAEEEAKASGAKTGKGFEDSLKEELGRGIPVIAGKAGEDIDEKVQEKTRDTGDKAGKKIGSEVGRSLNTLLRDLQLSEIDIKADSSKAMEEIAKARAELKALSSDNMTIEVKVRTERAMSELDKFAKNFIKDGEDGAKNFFQAFASNVSKQFEGFSLNGAILPIIGVVAAGAAPGIGAAIAGAVVGGVGLGGIIGGVALAAKDPRVQTELQVMNVTIMDKLKDASRPFIDVTIKGIHDIGSEIQKIDFSGIFQNLAGQAGPIIDGITTAVHALGKGLEDVAHNSGPAVKEIGNEIGAIGESLGHGLSLLSEDSKQGASGMHELFMIINGTVDSTFELIHGLSQAYGWLNKISGGGLLNAFDAIGSSQAHVAGKTKEMASAIAASIPVMNLYGRQTLTDGTSLNELAEASYTAANAQLGLFGDLTSVARAQANASKAAKENGRTLDANTEKGRNNRDALTSLGSALVKNSEDYYALNGAGAATQKVMANNRAAFLRAAESMTKSKKEAEALTDAIFGIPNKDVYINVHTVSDGRERVDQSGHRVGGYYGPGGLSGRAMGGVVGAAASGGTRSGLTMVNEQGPELLDLPPGTTVHTAGDSARMMKGGHHDSQPLEINLVLDGHVLATAMMDPQRRIVWQQFGGSVQAAYGRG